jgi:hypothetical protein
MTPKASHGTPLRGEAGNDGLEGPLAGRVDVGVSILKGEELAAILEHEAEAVGDQARAHAAEVRLNHRDHHAVFVGGGEVGGVAVAGSLAGIDGVEDAVEADEFGAFLCVVLRVEPVDGDFCEVGIGVVAGAVFIGEALGFDLTWSDCGTGSPSAHVELLDDVEHLQCGQALRVGAHAVDVDAAVVGDERFDPLGLMLAEIFFARASRRCA